MAIILDADVIIRGEKGTFDLQRWVAARPDEQFEVAAVTVAEYALVPDFLRISSHWRM